MLLPLLRLQQRCRRLLLLLLALPLFSIIASVCSSSLCFMPRRLHARGPPRGRATTELLFAGPGGAAVLTTTHYHPSFLTAHRRCHSLATFTCSRPGSSLSAGGPNAGAGEDSPQPPVGPRVQAVLEQLQQLTLLEVSELVRQLERVFGVSAASALGAAAAGTAAAAPAGAQSSGDSGASAAPAAPEKTAFKVVVKAVPTANRISVIKTLRSLRSDLGLKEAKNFIDTLPKDVTENIEKAEAQKIFDALKAAGAEVEMV